MFYLPEISSEKVTEDTTKGVVSLPFRLIDTLFTALVVFPPFVLVTENLIGSGHILELFERRLIVFILVRVVLKRHLFESFFYFLFSGTPLHF